MNPTLIKGAKYSPLIIGLLILCVGTFFVPWRQVVPYFSRLSLESYVAVAVLGAAFYIVRILRYRYMLGILQAPRSFFETATAYFIAQPISLLPAGEAYRVLTLKRHANVPPSKGLPVVFIQSFTENAALILLALISALYLNRYVWVIIGLLFLNIAIFLLSRSKRSAEKSRRLINKIPMVTFAQKKFHAFISQNEKLLSGKSMVVLFLSGFASSAIAIALLFIVANDIGIKLTVTSAIIAFALPNVLQNISFLPGGLGVNEQSSVGILLILGSSLPAAVALTLLMRFVTLVLGVLLGVIAIVVSKASK